MNSNLNVNYNSISKEYNNRYKLNDLSGIYSSLEEIIKTNNYQNILEVGCGTGFWINRISKDGRNIFGCDLSTGMLKEADNSKNNCSLFCANANQLPIKTQKFDLIYCVNALHHFPNKKSFISGSKKLLTKNGSLCIYGIDPRFEDDEWYLYDYFENSYNNDLIRFPSFTDIHNLYNTANYKNIKFEIVQKVKNDRTTANIFDDPFLQKGGTSQLAMLNEDEYQNGISKIKESIQKNKNQIFKTRITFGLISGKNI